MTVGLSDFYGDDVRWFVGVVINNNDPDGHGRVQVRIHGIHGDDLSAVPDHMLPWAETMTPSTEGGVSGIGKIPAILPTAVVFGIFLDGARSQTPMVLGSLIHREGPSQTQKTLAGQRGEARAYSSDAIGTDGVVTNPVTQKVYEANPDKDTSRIVAMQHFVENGFTPIVAAGIVGNLEAESAFRTTVVSSVEGEKSQGLAQWNPAVGRLQKLKAYANRLNKDWTDFFVQLNFIIHEFRGKSVGNDGGADFAGVYQKLKNCTVFEGGVSDKNSTWIFERYYEIPSNPESKLTQREVYARRAYETWSLSFISSGL